MTSLGRIFKDYRDSGALNALVNIHAAIDAHTFLTKSGGLLQVLRVQGIDAECLDPNERDQVARRFEAALRVFDERFRIYQYLLKRDHAVIPHEPCANPVAEAESNRRLAYLAGKTLSSFESYLVVVYEGWRPAGQRLASGRVASHGAVLRMFSVAKTVAALEEGIDRAGEVLTRQVASFTAQMRDALGLELLGKDAAFRFLRRLLNYAPEKSEAVRLACDSFVDYQACDSSLEGHRDHLLLDEFHVRVLTLKTPPGHTFADVLGALKRLPVRFILASEWKRADSLAVRRLIQSKRRHFHNGRVSLASYATASTQSATQDMLVDDSAVALVHELGACLEELEVNGQTFGQYSLSVVLYDTDPAVVRRAAAECVKVFGTYDAHLTDERYNLLNAWLSVLPGNDAYNLRRLWITSTNCADLAVPFAPNEGTLRNAHLNAEYLAVLETEQGSPYFLNLHVQDTAHTLVTGATGSGKSFLLNFLLTHAQKYSPRTFVFDLGGSYEALAERFGGTALRVGRPGSVSINPFCLPPAPQNLRFLLEFCRVLIESGGYRMNAADEGDLAAQIENVYAVGTRERRLSTLANIVSRPLRSQLERWVTGGPHGAYFDNSPDTLTFATFQVFDFEGMEDAPEVLEPLLFYVLHRANAAIYEPSLAGTFKIFVMDEAWRFFRHPTIRNYMTEGLKTWRKKNAAMVLATQSVDDLVRSELLSVVVESCATQIFLANPGMNPQAYQDTFHLNDTATAWIAKLVPKQQLLIKQSGHSKVVSLNAQGQLDGGPETQRSHFA